jgi:hypothetical protein
MKGTVQTLRALFLIVSNHGAQNSKETPNQSSVSHLPQTVLQATLYLA